MKNLAIVLLLAILALSALPAAAAPQATGILLVDDDWDYQYTHPGSLGGRPYYASALEALGLAYEVWDVQAQGQPTGAALAGRDAVLWFTGYAYEDLNDDPGVFTPQNETRVATYLDAGGRFLLSSSEYFYDAGTVTPFMQNYLGVQEMSDVWTYTTLLGTPGNPVGDGIGPLALARPDDFGEYWPPPPFEGPYDDEVYPQPGTGTPFHYNTDPFPPSSTNHAAGAFHTVFLGWPFEWIDTANQRAQVLGAILAWMGCAWPLPGAPLLSPIENADGDGTYSIDWSDATGATLYILEEDDDPAFGSPAVRYRGPESQFALSGQPAGIWYYRARASSPFGDGPWSNAQAAGVVPGASVLAAISNPDANGSYLVDWSDVAGAATYALQEDDNPGFLSPAVRYTGAASQYQVVGQPSGTWYYRVQAANAAGAGPWSNTEAAVVVLTLHLYRLTPSWSASSPPGTYKVTATASVHNQDHGAVSGVTVSGKWKLPDGSVLQKSAVTNPKGMAPFSLTSSLTGVYRFCVTGVQKSGYTYDPAANETNVCRSFTVGP